MLYNIVIIIIVNCVVHFFICFSRLIADQNDSQFKFRMNENKTKSEIELFAIKMLCTCIIWFSFSCL